MSRFELYGSVECGGCKYYVRGIDDSCETPRCKFPDNMYKNWLGIAYKRRPDDLNWDYRCTNFKEKQNGN